MFLSRNTKINVHRCKPQCYYIKMGFSCFVSIYDLYLGTKLQNYIGMFSWMSWHFLGNFYYMLASTPNLVAVAVIRPVPTAYKSLRAILAVYKFSSKLDLLQWHMLAILISKTAVRS